jgi:hypothetical protein
MRYKYGMNYASFYIEEVKIMKKIILMLAFVLCMGGVAGAATITDTTSFTKSGTNESGDLVAAWGDVNYLGWIGDFVTWKHQFAFEPAAATIDSATLTISLRDNKGEGDGGFLGWKNEYAFGWTESGNWDFGEVNTGDYAYGVDVNFLADGVFQVTIGSVWGDFYIDQSMLTINYTPVSTTVPEPTTLLLLGLGLVGLAGAKRKFKK